MRSTLLVAAAFALGVAPARAETPADFAAAFAAEARRVDPAFAGFSAARGQQFFAATHGGDWSCASCHGNDPSAVGEHVVTGKRIEPLAPAANSERFTRPASVEKWFKRNCNDVLKRPCTAQQEGDVLAWLMTSGARSAR
jgi:mono/diheme cytochrome c family protein